ncbi:MAG: pyridoxamine 5'-phosphate oxidase family protein [Ornithinibacter sp.]
MSTTVPLAQLAQTMENHPFAYLLTVSEGERVHAVAVDAVVEGDHLLVPRLGRRTVTNCEACPSVTLLWPPARPGGYSLIVDGTAERLGDGVAVSPARAVLHRPAGGSAEEEASGDACGSDCVELPTD